MPITTFHVCETSDAAIYPRIIETVSIYAQVI